MTPNVVTTIFAAKDLMSKKILAMQSTIAKAGQKAFTVGRKAAITGLLIGAPLVLAAKQAVGFEEKMADVGKTTGLQGKALENFGNQILELSTKTRSSIEDLSAIATIGGQLGVPREEILKFTEAANKFNIALGSDFSGGVEEAVTTIGKMKNLFADTRDLDISTAIMKSGSAINELGAVGAGTSANISDFALRVGALSDKLKPAASATLALGTYLEEMGIDSQIGASGFSNLAKIAAENFPAFAKQMKISSKEAQKLFEADPAQFLAKFAQGLKGMDAATLAKTLNKLKINSVETFKVLGALSSDQVDSATGLSRLATLYGISSKAMEENTSLTAEAEKKEKTAAAQMARLKNNIRALAITVGNALLPVISSLTETIVPMVQSAANWAKRNRGLTSTIVKVAASVAGFSLALSGVAYIVGGFQKGMALVTAAMKLFGIQSTLAMGPLGLMIVAFATIAAGAYVLAKAFKTTSAAEELNNEVRERALEKTIDQRVEIVQLFAALRRAKTGTEEYTATLKKIDEIQPGITEKYKDQNGVVRDSIALQKELTAAIMRRAKEEARVELAKESIKKQLEIVSGTNTTTAEDLLSSLPSWLGGNTETANKLKAGRVANEAWRQQELEKQITQDQNLRAQEAEKAGQNDKLTIEFANAPEGTKAFKGGKTIAIGAGKPKLSLTR